MIKDVQRQIKKLTHQLIVIKLQRQARELSHQLAKMKKNKLEDREESDHESIVNLKNSFQIYEQTRKILDHN